MRKFVIYCGVVVLVSMLLSWSNIDDRPRRTTSGGSTWSSSTGGGSWGGGGGHK